MYPMENKGGLKLTPKCQPILSGKEKFWLRKDPLIALPKAASKKHPSVSQAGSADIAENIHTEVLEKLKSLRWELSQKKSTAYIIFHNRTLEHLARALPDSIEEMGNIQGIRRTKLEQYGERFLKIIRQYKEAKKL